MTARHMLILLASSALGLLVLAGLSGGAAVSVWAGVAVLVLAVVLAMFLEGLSFLGRKAEHTALEGLGARLATLEAEHGKTAKTVREIREQVTFRE